MKNIDWKKAGKAFLFPHIAVCLVLLPVSAAFLALAMIFTPTESVIAVISYVLATYTLTIWCCRIPYLIGFFKKFRTENRYAKQWFEDVRLRMNISLYGSLIWNTVYAVFQLGLGIYHNTFWYCSLAGYYISLAVMRFFLVRHTSKSYPGENMKEELVRYRTCGIIFLMMNLSLSLIIFFMVYWNRTFYHHEITTIAIASYTFTSLTLAIINTVKYRKYNSPVYSASKNISLAVACVSMLTLESTMLTTFSDGTMDMTTRKIMIAISGGVLSAFFIAMAIYMIIHSSKKLKLLRTKKTDRQQVSSD